LEYDYYYGLIWIGRYRYCGWSKMYISINHKMQIRIQNVRFFTFSAQALSTCCCCGQTTPADQINGYGHFSQVLVRVTAKFSHFYMILILLYKPCKGNAFVYFMVQLVQIQRLTKPVSASVWDRHSH
jgi:hypothetical protein